MGDFNRLIFNENINSTSSRPPSRNQNPAHVFSSNSLNDVSINDIYLQNQNLQTQLNSLMLSMQNIQNIVTNLQINTQNEHRNNRRNRGVNIETNLGSYRDNMNMTFREPVTAETYLDRLNNLMNNNFNETNINRPYIPRRNPFLSTNNLDFSSTNTTTTPPPPPPQTTQSSNSNSDTTTIPVISTTLGENTTTSGTNTSSSANTNPQLSTNRRRIIRPNPRLDDLIFRSIVDSLNHDLPNVRTQMTHPNILEVSYTTENISNDIVNFIRNMNDQETPTNVITTHATINNNTEVFVCDREYLDSINENEQANSTCIICMGEIEESDIIRKISKCSHAFHMNCLDRWLESKITCPLCRTDIRQNNAETNTNTVADNTTETNTNTVVDNTTETDNNT